jgi:hypothetical protein
MNNKVTITYEPRKEYSETKSKTVEYILSEDSRFSNNEIFKYIPLSIISYYNRKRVYNYIDIVDTSISHLVSYKNYDKYYYDYDEYYKLDYDIVPYYIKESYHNIMNFKFDDESAYTKCKVKGYILLNILAYEFMTIKIDDNVVEPNDIAFLQTNEKVRINSQVQGSRLFDGPGYDKYKPEYLKAAIIAGIKYSNILSNHKKLNFINNYICDDVCNFILKDYIYDNIKLNEKYFGELNKNNRDINEYLSKNIEDNIDKFEWLCDLYYVSNKKYKKYKKNMRDKITIKLSYESGTTIGFPIDFQDNRYYTYAQIFFCLKNKPNIIFIKSDYIRLHNYKTFDLNNL